MSIAETVWDELHDKVEYLVLEVFESQHIFRSSVPSSHFKAGLWKMMRNTHLEGDTHPSAQRISQPNAQRWREAKSLTWPPDGPPWSRCRPERWRHRYSPRCPRTMFDWCARSPPAGWYAPLWSGSLTPHPFSTRTCQMKETRSGRELYHSQADTGGVQETALAHYTDIQHISAELTVQHYGSCFESTSRPVGWHSELTLQSNRVWSPGLWCWEERRKQRGSFVITHLTATRGSWVAPHSKMAVVPLMTRLSMGGLDMDVRPWSKHNTVNSALVQHFYASLFNSLFTRQQPSAFPSRWDNARTLHALISV